MGIFSDAVMVGVWLIIIYFVFFSSTNNSNSIITDTTSLEEFCNRYGMNSTTSGMIGIPFEIDSGCSISMIANDTFVTTACEAIQVNSTWYWKDAQCPVKLKRGSTERETVFHEPEWRR